MSGQASRSRARTLERWRRQAARLVASVVYGDLAGVHCAWCAGTGEVDDPLPFVEGDTETCRYCGGSGAGADGARLAIERGETFDVRAARAHCERLVSEGERRAVERPVFEDWTREHGLGPENRDAHARECPDCHGQGGGAYMVDDMAMIPDWKVWECDQCRGFGMLSGGWPGRLAAEWGTVECSACAGRGRIGATLGDPPRATTLPCAACRGRGRTPRPEPDARHRDAASGPGLARTAQRLLDTLDGRCPWAPSAGALQVGCTACQGDGIFWENPCRACNGTGHNLRGVLPAVEASPCLRSKVADGVRAYDRNGQGVQREQWWTLVSRADGWRPFHGPTRVVPRGEHREPAFDMHEPPIQRRQSSVERLLLSGMVGSHYDAHEVAREFRRRLPAWRRGEIKHAAQRRARMPRWRELLPAQGQALDQIGAFVDVDRLRGERDAVFRDRLRVAAGLAVELDDGSGIPHEILLGHVPAVEPTA